jgi:hypothetical protein
VSDGSCVSVVESEMTANSVGIIVERDGQLAVTNSSFADNDMAAFLAGQFSEGAAVRLANVSISGRTWFHRRRPGTLTESNVVASGGTAAEHASRREGAGRGSGVARAARSGLELDDDSYDSNDIMYRGWHPGEAESEVLSLIVTDVADVTDVTDVTDSKWYPGEAQSEVRSQLSGGVPLNPQP